MKKSLVILSLLWTGCFRVSATDNLRVPDVRALGMGGNGGAHSAFFNPSLLGLQTERSARVDYYNRYSVNELATGSAGFCFPNPVLPVGFHLASFGYDAYRESLFRLSTGKRLNDAWALGVSVQYAVMQSELFETDPTRMAADIGLAFQPVENVLLGLSVINFPSVSLNEESADSKRIGSYQAELNVNWNMMGDVLLTAGAAHGEETPLSASFGMEYLPFDDFCIRTGIRTSPFRPSLGVGCRLGIIMADAAMIYHPLLGVSMGLGLSCSF